MTDSPNIISDIKSLKLMIEGGDTSTSLPLRRTGFDEDKDFIKFIRSIERLIRGSVEYHEWVRYIKETLGHSECTLTHERSCETNVDIHHHPINLFTIVKSVTNSYINKEKEFCSYDIALQVIDLHFQNRIGYMPVLSDLHLKHHNGFLKLPIDHVHGDWMYIINNYPFEDVDLQIVSEYSSVKSEDLKEVWTRNLYKGVVNE